ncbi:gluconeogenesis factor YvcK family protein [Corynebacterium uberis]|uniref:gluconeogenesis factor YvcK family protein n=1 Tax=Corynebacterium uberis TaxID=2883169 RepID=UPI001D099F23|nr:uridine diphosphate-N-acetylglucosamine-binding protein YvcK [Corynebacterium uberis]UDL76951.1 uridine diphosphate-N-acetylglucosamine-binding protein YvcK [Corynebacterium uberis]
MGLLVSLGGGHGLYQTLRAGRLSGAEGIVAVGTVADDGGSSGRIRRELAMIPPGDLRMALAALAGEDESGRMWAQALQHRFGGNGALAGHALGNLVISGLTEVLGDTQQALDIVGALTGSSDRVLPVCLEPLDIEADVAGLDNDPRIVRPVRGQVAVASTPGSVRRVRLIPENPQVNAHVLDAIAAADMITLGPGSWFSSVIPHLLIPELVEAMTAASAVKVVVLNLSAEPGETQGFSSERHLHMLAQHAPGLRVDWIMVDRGAQLSSSEKAYLQRAAQRLGAQVVYRDVEEVDSDGRRRNRHDPAKLAAALRDVRRLGSA